MDVRWVTAFIDRPALHFQRTREFWRAVLGATVAPTRGERDEFATFRPSDGDAFVRIQRTADGSAGTHVDLHGADPRAAADEAIELGADQLDDLGDVVVLRSPGGVRFCCVRHHGEHRRPSPSGAPGRGVLVHQVSIDVAPDRAQLERRFWSSLTGWVQLRSRSDAFTALERRDPIPLQFVFQRRGDDDAGLEAEVHLDACCDDRAGSVDDHERLGASVVAIRDQWTVMADPAGVPYCLTDRPTTA
jgi:hypothetical protein